MRIRLILTAVTVVCAASIAPAQNPAAIEHHLRYGVRLADQPDVALDLLERMRSYHVPGLSIAVIDNYRVVFAKGYGVAEFGGSQAGRQHHALPRRLDQQTGIRERLSPASRGSQDSARRRRQLAAQVVASSGQPLYRTREGDAPPAAHTLRRSHRLGIPRLRTRRARSDGATAARRCAAGQYAGGPQRHDARRALALLRRRDDDRAARRDRRERRGFSDAHAPPDASAGRHDAQHI